MRFRNLLAGAGLVLAFGWNVARADDAEVTPVSNSEGCSSGACFPNIGKWLFPWRAAPGTSPDSALDGPNASGGTQPGMEGAAPGTGVNPGSQFGTSAPRSAFTDVPLHGDQFGVGVFGPGSPALPPSSFGNGTTVALSKAGVVAPSIRGFKITEDESPRPTDRFYYDFNYFDRVNDSVNKHFGFDIDRINAYRSTFGLEKTFLDGDMSIGFRLPLNTLEIDSKFAENQNTNTALGDLTMILKYAAYRNMQTGNVFSFGLALTAPTGSQNFGGAPIFTGFHSTILQPYLGYIYHYQKWFVEGFSAVSVPMDPNDVTMLYNDLGLGYILYQAGKDDNRIVTAIVPLLEAHLNDPLNHQGAFQADDPAGTPDVLSFTGGVTFVVERNFTVGLAVVVPVTGPRPYDVEAQFQLNWVFGAPKR